MGSLADIKKGMASTTGNKVKDEPKVTTKTASAPVVAADSSDIIPSLFSNLGVLYINMAVQFGNLDMDMLTANDKLAQEGLRPEERVVYFEAADYLASNFGYIMAALCLDYKNIRNIIIDNINVELDLDRMSEDKRKELRKKMNEKPAFKANPYSMAIGITNFSNYVSAGFEQEADAGFNKIKGSKLEKMVDEAVTKFGDKERSVLGFIFSEYIYFVRAFNHNAKFTFEFMKLIDDLKATYGF